MELLNRFRRHEEPKKPPEQIEEVGSLEDIEYQWATDANWREVPPDNFLQELQLKANLYLNREIENWPLNITFNGRFGKKTMDLFMKLFEVANIDYDPKDFDKSTGKIILRASVINQIQALDLHQKPEQEQEPEAMEFSSAEQAMDRAMRDLQEQMTSTTTPTTEFSTGTTTPVSQRPFDSAERHMEVENPQEPIPEIIDEQLEINSYYTKALAVNPEIDPGLVRLIYQIAKEENVPVRDMFWLFSVESELHSNRINAYGYKGLGQLSLIAITDVYHRGPRHLSMDAAGSRAEALYRNNNRVLDSATNIRLSAQYYNICRNQIGSNDFSLIFLAYNQGPGSIKELMGIYGNNPQILWNKVKMRGDNPKEKVLGNIKKFGEIFA